MLRWKSFVSSDGEHGFGVGQAQWTDDSQFFVFGLSSSGGHQPWHYPVYFYSREKNRFYCLDDYVGPITSAFTVTNPDAVMTTRMALTGVPNTEGKDEKITVHLNKILKRSGAKVQPR